MGMGINHWEWEGMRLKKIFLLISNHNVDQTNFGFDTWCHCVTVTTGEDRSVIPQIEDD